MANESSETPRPRRTIKPKIQSRSEARRHQQILKENIADVYEAAFKERNQAILDEHEKSERKRLEQLLKEVRRR